MKYTSLITLLIIATLFASKKADPVTEDDGISQFYSILAKLEEHQFIIPPDIERVAIYRIRVDEQAFSNGVARFIREQLEESFRKESRIQVVTAPELRTVRIDITDTTFSFKNTIPSLEELWKLGKKLRVDGFLDGSITMTENNEMLLTLKLIRNNTGEVVWSQAFTAGRIEKHRYANPPRFQLTTSARIVPLAENGSINPSTGVKVLDEEAKLFLYGLGIQLRQYVNPTSHFFFQVHLIGSIGTFKRENSSYITSSIVYGGDFGVGVIPKKDGKHGYFVDISFGIDGVKILPYLGSVISLTNGYGFNISDNFGVNLGINFYPFENTVYSEQDTFITTDKIGVSFGIIFTF